MNKIARLTGLAFVAAGLAFTTSCFADPPAFEPVGLGGGGAMYSPAASPHDPRLMFVSCDMSGFYRSEDGGKSWRMLDKRQMRSCTSMRPVFHPTDPNVVYAWGNDDLRVSRDKGLTWKPLSATAAWGGPLSCLAVDRGDPKLMLAGGGGAFVSTDAGATWAKAPGVEGRAVGAFILPKGPVLTVGTEKGVFLSDDRGQTWRPLNDGLPSTAIRGLCGGYDLGSGAGLLYCTVPSVAKDGQYVGGVYKLVVGTNVWQSAMGEGINVGTKRVDEYGADEVAQYQFTDMDETRPRTVWVTTRGTGYWPPNHWTVYRTDDAGAHWRYTFTGDPRFNPRNVDCGWVVYDLSSWGFGGPPDGFSVCHGNAEVAMYTNNAELFLTTDGGKSWHNGFCRTADGSDEGPGKWWVTTGLDVTSCWEVVLDPFRPGNVYIAYTDIGFARSEDGGKSWQAAVTGSPWRNTFYRVVPDPATAGVLYAACSNTHDIPEWGATTSTTAQREGGVCVSVDFGKTWKSTSEGLPAAPCTSIALDPKSPATARVLYAAMYGKGIYKSTDGGKTWAEASNGVGGPQNRNVYSVRLHPDGTVFCSVTADHDGRDFHLPSSLYRSTDAGATWTDIAASLQLRWAGDFDFDPTDSKVIYLTAATPPAFDQGGIYKTTDGGQTWRCLLGDSLDEAHKLPQDLGSYSHAFFVKVDEKNPGRIFFGAPSHGEFVSEDAGATWREILGIPFTACQRVTVDPADRNTIWVATFGGGAWRGTIR